MFSASAVLVCKYLFSVAKIWEFKTWKRRIRSTIRFSCWNRNGEVVNDPLKAWSHKKRLREECPTVVKS